jgi:hypothetical protein
MFYEDQEKSGFLRLGDVVKGFISAVPEMEEPFTDKKFVNYKVTVELPKLLVVLTPCCSIGDEKISLVPLEEVGLRSDLFKVPYLKEDMTRVNRKMEAKNAIIPQKWDTIRPEKQMEILNQPMDYQLKEFFIYAEHEQLPSYTVKIGSSYVKYRYYMIDFRMVTRVGCKSIISPNKEKAFTNEIKQKALDSKILELHRDTRQELRDKLVNYYGYIPNEDRCQTPV